MPDQTGKTYRESVVGFAVMLKRSASSEGEQSFYLCPLIADWETGGQSQCNPPACPIVDRFVGVIPAPPNSYQVMERHNEGDRELGYIFGDAYTEVEED